MKITKISCFCQFSWLISNISVMSYEEMFEKAQCCGVISVRSSNSKSGRFQKKWVSILNYTSNHQSLMALIISGPCWLKTLQEISQRKIISYSKFVLIQNSSKIENIILKNLLLLLVKHPYRLCQKLQRSKKLGWKDRGSIKQWQADIFMLLPPARL